MKKIKCALTLLLVIMIIMPGFETHAGTSVSYYWPVESTSISSKFGNRTPPTEGASSFHEGVDIPVRTGTSVYASAAGKVIAVGSTSSKGKYIKIKHADNRVTEYMHLSKQSVSNGTQVKLGTKIGESGNTGISTGPHLDFRITMTDGQTHVDPEIYVSKQYATTVLNKIKTAPHIRVSCGVFLYSTNATITLSPGSNSLGSIISYTISYKNPGDTHFCTMTTTNPVTYLTEIYHGTLLKVSATVVYQGNQYSTNSREYTFY